MPEVPLIPGFQLQHRLAAGRHGGVWAGLRHADGWPVAIKVVTADRIKDASRFLREAAALASIDHEHVVRCLASGREDGFLWLAMDLAAGDLAVEVRAGPSDPQAVLEAGRDAAAGLAELHRRGLVHRDISPANLLRMSDGRVVVGDFGLVSGDHERLTRQGEVLGTPAYLSPEQAAGAAVDARADIYALGAVLYAVATGQPPYQGDNTWGMLSRIAAGPFPDPRDQRPDLPLQLRAIILAATGLRPEDRYPHADQLREDCIAALAGGIPRHAGQVRARQLADPVPVAPVARERAHPAPAIVLGALAGLALGAVPGWLLLRPDPLERSDFAIASSAGDAEAWRRYALAHPGGTGIPAAQRALAVLEAAPAVPEGRRHELERDLARLEEEVARLRREPAPVITPPAPAQPAAASPPAVAPVAAPPAVPAAVIPAAPPPAAPASSTVSLAARLAGAAANQPLVWPSDDPPPPPAQPEPPAGLPTRLESGPVGLGQLAGVTVSPLSGSCLAAWDANLRLAVSCDGGAIWRIVDQGERSGNVSRRPGSKASWSGAHGFIPGDGPVIGWRTRNGGLSWHRVKAPDILGGMGAPQSTAHRAMLADHAIAVVLQDAKEPRIWRVAVLTEGAAAWQQTATVMADRLVLAAAGSRLLLLRGDSGRWMSSTDLGGSWRNLATGAYERSAWSQDGSTLRFMSWRDGLVVLDTASERWSSETLFQPEAGNLTAFATDPRSPSTVFAVDERSGLLRTSDQGRTWRLLSPDRAIWNLEVAGRTRPRLVWASGSRITSVDIDAGFGPGAK